MRETKVEDKNKVEEEKNHWIKIDFGNNLGEDVVWLTVHFCLERTATGFYGLDLGKLLILRHSKFRTREILYRYTVYYSLGCLF